MLNGETIEPRTDTTRTITEVKNRHFRFGVELSGLAMTDLLLASGETLLFYSSHETCRCHNSFKT